MMGLVAAIIAWVQECSPSLIFIRKWMAGNPVTEVWQTAKREGESARLTAEELGSLMMQLDFVYPVMIESGTRCAHQLSL